MSQPETGQRLNRLRAQILTGCSADLRDEELVELLLSIALHRYDVRELAAELIRRFGSLASVLSASPTDLSRVKGIGQAVSVLIKLVEYLRSSRPDSEKLSSHSPLVATNLPIASNVARVESPENHVRELVPHQPTGVQSSPDGRLPQTDSRRGSVRAIQDLIWKEALLSLPWSERFDDLGEFQSYIRQNLPQNSLSTRDRYAQSLIRWFYPDGMQGLTAQVWQKYRDPILAEEILRFLYLEGEPMTGFVVADTLYPISENALIPESYIAQFVEDRFGPEIPAKTVERLKANLRKLGFLSPAKGHRDSLRAVSPSPTAFLILLHRRFALGQPGGVEFRTVAADPFWKYLGYKSEDQLRTVLREALDRGLIAKYVVADRIESISLRYSFHEFVDGRMRL